MHLHVRHLVIVEPGALQLLVVHGKSERLHQMQASAGVGGKPGPLFRRAWQGYQEFKSKVMRKEAVSA